MPTIPHSSTRRSNNLNRRIAATAVGALLAVSLLTHTGVAHAAVLPASPAPIRASLALSHVPMVVRGLEPLRLTAPAQQIGIDFALKPRNADQIPALLQAISDPKSQMYGHYLTQAEYRAKFAPTQAQVDQVVAYAKAQGLTVGHVSASRMLVHASGTAAQMNAAFGVTLRDYVSPDLRDNGRIFHAPTSEPTINASIAPLLTGVVGLSNAAVPHSDARRVAQAANASHSTYIGPQSTANCYGLNSSLQTYSGQGQVLGLLEFDTFYQSDITAWENDYSLTPTYASIVPVSVDGASPSATPGSGQGEVTLDIDMLLSLAYNASQIRVYEAPLSETSSTTASFSAETVDIFDAMANDSTPPSVISSSWGSSELNFSQSEVQSEANALQQLALQGQTVCVASGDNGADDSGAKNTLSLDDPSAQPSVVSVGGTDMTVVRNPSTAPASMVSQTSWYDSADTGRGPAGTGGGGGISKFWSIPSWQQGICENSANTQGSTTMRNSPDVSLYGDYDTGGYYVYATDPGKAAGNESGYYNGTSAASPLWAAILADTNQERIANGLPPLGLATPQIYDVAESSAYGTDFDDINDNSTNGFYNAVAGYDNSTGWGTPLNGSQLITDLAAEPAAAEFSLTFSSNDLGPNQSATGTVTLPQAESVAETFTLSGNWNGVLSVPVSVTVPAGSTSATFTVTAGTIPYNSNDISDVTATLDYASASQYVEVDGPQSAALVGFTINPSTVNGGSSTTGQVTLSEPAPTDEVIGLSSNDPSTTVPANVTVPQGQTSASFTITTTDVSAQTTVYINASDPQGDETFATLTVNPVPANLNGLTITPTSVVGGQQNSTITVNVSAPAPLGGEQISVSSSDPSIAVPSSVTVPAGQQSVTFTATSSAVTTSTTVEIPIQDAQGNSVVGFIKVVPVPAVSGFTLNPTTVVGGQQNSTATVMLSNANPSSDTTIAISDNDTTQDVTVPPSVTIPAGQTSATFTVGTSVVNSQDLVTIAATLGGNSTDAQLTVNPVAAPPASTPANLRALTLAASSQQGPATLTGNRVYVHGNAPANEVVTLTSSDPSAVSVPASVTINSGTSSRTFNLSVSKTAPNETVTITASYNGQTQTAQIAVSPAPITLKSVVASPASTEGGTSTTANRVYLTGNATATTVVSLTSSNPAVLSVPKTITVQQGYSSHVFTVTSQPVTSEQDVTITATSGGMTQTTVVTVTP